MTTINATLSQPKWDTVPFIRRFFYKSLYTNVPRRIKRLIFIASILALIDGNSEINKYLATKLNNILQIAYNDEALYFPMAIKSIIWKSIIKNPLLEISGKVYNILNISEIRTNDPYLNNTSNFLISNMPAWLVYGSVDMMHHDIEVLFKKVLP
jgi:hypothetical protein